MADGERGLTDPGKEWGEFYPFCFLLMAENFRDPKGHNFRNFTWLSQFGKSHNAQKYASIMSVGGAERSHSVDARPFTPLEHPFFAGKN